MLRLVYVSLRLLLIFMYALPRIYVVSKCEINAVNRCYDTAFQLLTTLIRSAASLEATRPTICRGHSSVCIVSPLTSTGGLL